MSTQRLTTPVTYYPSYNNINAYCPNHIITEKASLIARLKLLSTHLEYLPCFTGVVLPLPLLFWILKSAVTTAHKRKSWGSWDQKSASCFLDHEKYDVGGGFPPPPPYSKVCMTLVLIIFNTCNTLIFISLQLHIISLYIMVYTVCIAYSRHLLFLLFCPRLVLFYPISKVTFLGNIGNLFITSAVIPRLCI